MKLHYDFSNVKNEIGKTLESGVARGNNITQKKRHGSCKLPIPIPSFNLTRFPVFSIPVGARHDYASKNKK